MSTLFAWFKGKSAWAHSLTASAISLAGLITMNEHVRDYVLSLFAQHPKIGTAIVALAAIIVNNNNPNSKAGIVAAAKQVLDSPDAPTAKAVDAATPPK